MRAVTSLPHAVREAEHVWIPMADGIRLGARIWRPVSSDDEPVPAILEYIPYRKRDLTSRRDSIHHPYFAGHGYASVRVDIRGSGDSEGVLTDEYLERELDDAEQVLEWLAGRDWCTGRVGMMGISWGGFNALQVAARNPANLDAIISVCATDDRYADDVHYMGGCLLSDNLSWAATMFAYTASPPDPAVVGERWREMWTSERMRGSGAAPARTVDVLLAVGLAATAAGAADHRDRGQIPATARTYRAGDPSRGETVRRAGGRTADRDHPTTARRAALGRHQGPRDL